MGWRDEEGLRLEEQEEGLHPLGLGGKGVVVEGRRR